MPDSLTTYVTEGSTGWIAPGIAGLPEDGKWQGCKIAYWTSAADPIPELPADAPAEEVAAALAGSADARLAANITDTVAYVAYRTWAQSVKGVDGAAAGMEAVKNSAQAWLSFALDSATLVVKAPEAGDVTITAFAPSADGAFNLSISVKDIEVGGNASPVNLARVFRVEGGMTPDTLAADAVDLVFGTPENGRVKVSATPKDASATSFFMRVVMMP